MEDISFDIGIPSIGFDAGIPSLGFSPQMDAYDRTAVHYTADAGKTESEKAVARNNIGAVSVSDVAGKENTSNKVTSLSSASTNTQYPSAKCVYDELDGSRKIIGSVYNVSTVSELTNIFNNDGKKKTIFLESGTYDISSWVASNNSELVLKRIDLIGVGHATIQCRLTNPNSNLSALRFFPGENGSVKNITVVCKNCRYAICDDNSSTQGDSCNHSVENCIVIHEGYEGSGFNYPRAFGSVVRDNVFIEIKNCDMYSLCNDDMDFASHASATDNSKVLISGCFVKNGVSVTTANGDAGNVEIDFSIRNSTFTRFIDSKNTSNISAFFITNFNNDIH